MPVTKGYEFLCDEKSGSVTIIRFYSKEIFELLETNYIQYKNNRIHNNLRYATLKYSEDDCEDVLLSFIEYPELHIHGGIANKKKIELLLCGIDERFDCMDEASKLSDWEKCFSSLKGSRAISYMLELKESNFIFNQNEYDQEGFEFLECIKVCLVGPPNAGKSTLFNYFLGTQRALVSPVAGTTRDVLSTMIIINGFEVKLIDTAGLFEEKLSLDDIHDESQKISRKIISDSDIVITFNSELPNEWVATEKQIAVSSKCDMENNYHKGLLISCHTKQGINELIDILAKKIKNLKGNNISPKFLKPHIK